MTCRHCGELVKLTPDKPGLIDECHDCAVDVPRYRAEAEDENGSGFGLVKTHCQDVRLLHAHGFPVAPIRFDR